MYVLLVVLLIIALLGIPPVGIHQYGWMPSSAMGVLLVVLLILVLLGRI